MKQSRAKHKTRKVTMSLRGGGNAERSTIISPPINLITSASTTNTRSLASSTPQQSPGSLAWRHDALSTIIIHQLPCQSVSQSIAGPFVSTSSKTLSDVDEKDAVAVNPTKHAGPGTALPHPSDRLRGRNGGRDAMRGGRACGCCFAPAEGRPHDPDASRAASRHLLLMRLVLLTTAGRRGERAHARVWGWTGAFCARVECRVVGRPLTSERDDETFAALGSGGGLAWSVLFD
ncbi:uncharacterized protein J3D65DRAFT_623575 [Phyllosticta citribraziliensis]|uniref:Uncharacterized protein n=1 Tax=Phyllosticta citribraziliensis TaxID=989973 RepID=A0ABR1LNV5_9PEZI